MPKTRFQYRHQYDDAADARERELTDICNTEPSKTEQHHKDDCDLNIIAARYGITDGSIRPVPQDPSVYADFTDVPTFRQALDNVANAKAQFMNLPADIRARFANNAGIMWDWVTNPKNFDEAVELGFFKKPPEAATVTTPEASQTP